MRHYIDTFSRFFVGMLFIFSGLIKLNDPVGTTIKMEEYFEVFANDFGSFFHVFASWAMEISMLLIIAEVVLGVAVLLYYRMEITMILLLKLVVLFAVLTFYSAYFNKVTDCGCFGDAIKLTPWQSFSKDIILMVFVLHLFWYRKKYRPFLSLRKGDIAIAGVLVVSCFVGIYAIRHLPFIDFRPYRVGNSIPEQMEPEEQPIIEYRFEKQGKTVVDTTFLPKEEGYTYLSSKILNEDKNKPKIADYSVFDRSGGDMTSYTFQGTKLLIVITDVQAVTNETADHLNNLIRQLNSRVTSFILTSSPAEQIEIFRHENQLAVPYFYADATVLKTIIRANPGLTLWREGVVLGKWHYNDIPTAEEIQALL